MPKSLYRMHPVMKMIVCFLLTAMCFPNWYPIRLAVISGVFLVLLFLDYDRSIWKKLLTTGMITAVFYLISYLASKDVPGSVCGALHFTVLLLASFYMFQTPVSELLHGMQSCNMPDQMLLGFLVMYRFIDVLRDELRTVHQASTMVGLRQIGFFKKFYRCLIIPFTYRMFVLSDQLGMSIESRDFGCVKRTQYNQNQIRKTDVILTVLLCVSGVFILWSPLLFR